MGLLAITVPLIVISQENALSESALSPTLLSNLETFTPFQFLLQAISLIRHLKDNLSATSWSNRAHQITITLARFSSSTTTPFMTLPISKWVFSETTHPSLLLELTVSKEIQHPPHLPLQHPHQFPLKIPPSNRQTHLSLLLIIPPGTAMELEAVIPQLFSLSGPLLYLWLRVFWYCQSLCS